MQPKPTTTFSETALADHSVALAFKQAGTRFLLLTQDAPSAKSLGTVRHLPYTHLRPVRAQFGAVSPTGICGSHSRALVSPYAYRPGTLVMFLPLMSTCHPTDPCCHCLSCAAEVTEMLSTSVQPLPSLSLNFRPSHPTCSRLPL